MPRRLPADALQRARADGFNTAARARSRCPAPAVARGLTRLPDDVLRPVASAAAARERQRADGADTRDPEPGPLVPVEIGTGPPVGHSDGDGTWLMTTMRSLIPDHQARSGRWCLARAGTSRWPRNDWSGGSNLQV
jgi:hypothetical protein